VSNSDDRGVHLAIASVLISEIWFSLVPKTDWNGSGTFFYPFPFGAVHFETTPMPMPMPMP
jgi:hypothetical protein